MKPLITLFVKAEQKDLDLDQVVKEFAQNIGWENVLKEALFLLTLKKYQAHWYDCACVFFYAISDKIDIPIDKYELMARLYWCLETFPNLGINDDIGDADNLIWSIVHQLQGVSYTSYWNPLDEPEVKLKLKEIKEN